MNKYLLGFYVCVIFCCPASAQFLLKGRVLIKPGNKPLSYVNIGIINSSVGTISNEDGSFAILIPEKHSNDTLFFSALGYNNRGIPIRMLAARDRSTIYLIEKPEILETVTITGKREKPKNFELGNRYFKGGVILSDSVHGGACLALLIDNKYPSYYEDLSFPVYLEKARVRILKNNWNSFKYRVRLYEVDSLTGGPGKDILTESIVLESDMRKGWLEFDLSHLNFKIEKSFFLGFESILTDADRLLIATTFREFRKQHPDHVKIDTVLIEGKKEAREHIQWADFPGVALAVSPLQFSRDNYVCYSRESSFAPWKRSIGILTTRVTVNSQPVFLRTEKKNSTTETLCKETPAICSAVKLCDDFLDEYPVNGLQLCVSVKGEVKLSRGVGFADTENNIPVTPATRFRIGSVSKALTSAALVKLEAEKKLDLDAPVQKYTSFPEKKYTITTRQLAGHLAGIRHYRENDLSDLVRTDHFKNATEALKVFAGDSLLFKPGSKYHYSSFGWNLIGAVIEGASGQYYLTYMHTNIWKPLNMLATYGDVADSLMPGKSKFYDVTGEEAAPEDLSYKYPGGGLLSTAEDLVKFGNELIHPKYLNTALVNELFQTQFIDGKAATNYGLGWYIGKDENNHRIWFHAGDLLNSSAYLLIYPDDDIVVAFLANSQEGLSFNVRKIGQFFYEN